MPLSHQWRSAVIGYALNRVCLVGQTTFSGASIDVVINVCVVNAQVMSEAAKSFAYRIAVKLESVSRITLADAAQNPTSIRLRLRLR